MLRLEFVFFTVALMASAAGLAVPDGGAALLASKVVFAVAFALFASVLLGRQLAGRQRRGGPRGGTTPTMRPARPRYRGA